MGKMSREKGKRGERELVNVLNKMGVPARRGVQYHGGPESPDVVGMDFVHIEVKRVERLNIYDAYDQSVYDSADYETPVVAHRKNGKPWLVILGLADFVEMYKAWDRESWRDE